MTEPTQSPQTRRAYVDAAIALLKKVVPREELSMLLLVHALKEFVTDKGKAPVLTPMQQMLVQTSPEMLSVQSRRYVQAMQEQLDPFLAEMVPLLRASFEHELKAALSESGKQS